MELADRGITRALGVVDPALLRLAPVHAAVEALEHHGVALVLCDRVAVEPTDRSWRDAIAFAAPHEFDALVAIGGGSTLDTAKAINLYTCHPPRDFYDYVNAPVGKAAPVPGAVKPLFAVPTTAGTGSETTGVCIFDDTSRRVKTGISSPRLKPALALLDPDLTRTMPRGVAVSSGLDVLCHAVESYTAMPYTSRRRPERPRHRPPYQGANPISDAWSLQALRMLARFFVRAVEDPSDEEARGQMLLAASYAGIGFGSAGVHLPHAMSYPVAGQVRSYRAPGYPDDHPLVPHGISVILNAPAVFRFTASAGPQRHLDAAAALGADVSRARVGDAGAVLADRIAWFMDRLGVPQGLRAVGYAASDIPALVEGALLQQRLTTLAPRPVTADDLAALFEASL
jgi:hydroxyacid-oxoacid transhydrogenase